MSMRRALIAFLLSAGWMQAQAEMLWAATASPPTPSSTPVCGYCSGPPLPPTPIPTAAPMHPATGGASGPLPAAKRARVSMVTVSPQSVRRGHTLKVSVRASPGESLLLALEFQGHKALMYRGKISRAATYVKVIEVPEWTPLGKAGVKVTFLGHGPGSQSDALFIAFTVLR